MTKYMIHCCPDRLWYIEGYLIPKMKEQGIKDEQIILFNDTEKLGNLKACMKSFKQSSTEPGGTWHLQDDIVISKRFKELTEEYDNPNLITYGFSGYYDVRFDKFIDPGLVVPEKMWSSFQCEYIPNNIAGDWSDWMETGIIGNPVYRDYWKDGKGDDWWFKKYIQEKYKGIKFIVNLDPNIVDHIDYLMGGSIINPQRNKPIYRARYWYEEDVIEDVTHWLAKYMKKV